MQWFLLIVGGLA